jgi:hypothetical protein
LRAISMCCFDIGCNDIGLTLVVTFLEFIVMHFVLVAKGPCEASLACSKRVAHLKHLFSCCLYTYTRNTKGKTF